MVSDGCRQYNSEEFNIQCFENYLNWDKGSITEGGSNYPLPLRIMFCEFGCGRICLLTITGENMGMPED